MPRRKQHVDKKAKPENENTTSGWTLEFREQILKDLEESDILTVSQQHGVTMAQVHNCVARAQAIATMRGARQSRKEFLDSIEQKVRIGYDLGVQRLTEELASNEEANVVAITAEFRKGLEGVGAMKNGAPTTQTQNNFFGDVNIQDLTDEQLAERADNLARQFRRLPASTGPASGNIDGATPKDGEPAVYDVPGDGETKPPRLPKVHGVLQSGRNS